eukprot:1666691-Pleurochrysis_carterae.AAC.1
MPEEGRQTALSKVCTRSTRVREETPQRRMGGSINGKVNGRGGATASLGAYLPTALRVRNHRPTGGPIGERVLARAQTRKRRFAWR